MITNNLLPETETSEIGQKDKPFGSLYTQDLNILNDVNINGDADFNFINFYLNKLSLTDNTNTTKSLIDYIQPSIDNIKLNNVFNDFDFKSILATCLTVNTDPQQLNFFNKFEDDTTLYLPLTSDPSIYDGQIFLVYGRYLTFNVDSSDTINDGEDFSTDGQNLFFIVVDKVLKKYLIYKMNQNQEYYHKYIFTNDVNDIINNGYDQVIFDTDIVDTDIIYEFEITEDYENVELFFGVNRYPTYTDRTQLIELTFLESIENNLLLSRLQNDYIYINKEVFIKDGQNILINSIAFLNSLKYSNISPTFNYVYEKTDEYTFPTGRTVNCNSEFIVDYFTQGTHRIKLKKLSNSTPEPSLFMLMRNRRTGEKIPITRL